MARAVHQDGRKRVYLIDRHVVTRDGLRHLINAQPDLTVCGEGYCCRQDFPRLQATRPDLLVVEVLCRTGLRTDLIASLRESLPALRILAFSTGADCVYAERVLSAGANGYLSKDHTREELLEGIRQVLRGEVCVSQVIVKSILHKWSGRADRPAPVGVPVEQFSDRELECFRLIGEGQTTVQIARGLHVSVSTVETYRLRLKAKLALKTGAELTHCAVCWVESGAQRLKI
jgi:DNA-binding NarL/FixJ family response regulator